MLIYHPPQNTKGTPRFRMEYQFDGERFSGYGPNTIAAAADAMERAYLYATRRWKTKTQAKGRP